MKSIKNKNYGFTLIELLVVISIIGVLSSITFTNLDSARKKGRNAQRMENIHTIKNAFHLAASNNGGIFVATPVVGTPTYVCVTTSCYGYWSGYSSHSTVDTFLSSALPTKPTDPGPSSNLLGGILYINPTSYGGLPQGPFLDYIMEYPGTCGEGTLILNYPNANPPYINCYLRLD
jgi:prepilin-type N-terminal cleavage/methylation domain-containing protein